MDDLFGSDSDHSPQREADHNEILGNHHGNVDDEHQAGTASNNPSNDNNEQAADGLDELFGEDEKEADDHDNLGTTKENQSQDREGDVKKAKRAIIDDDDDDDEEEEAHSTTDIKDEGLFGSEEEEENDDDDEGLGTSEYKHFEEPEQPQKDVEIFETEVTLLKKVKPNDNKYILLGRWPNSLTLEAQPFEPEKHVDLLEAEHELNQKLQTGKKIPRNRIHQAYDSIRNAILWRKVVEKQTGAIKRQSNTRVIRWSDGSLTLMTGGGAHHNIESHPLAAPQPYDQSDGGSETTGSKIVANTLSHGPHYYYGLATSQEEEVMQTHFRFNDRWGITPGVLETRPGMVISQSLASSQVPVTTLSRTSGLSRKEKPIRFGTGGIFNVISEMHDNGAAKAQPAHHSGTKMFFGMENPELMAKQAEKEEAEREKALRKQERLKRLQEEREEKRMAYNQQEDYDDYDDEDLGAGGNEGGYSDEELGTDAERRASGNRQDRSQQYGARSQGPAVSRHARQRDRYYEDEVDDFVVSDNEQLEVGSVDEFEADREVDDLDNDHTSRDPKRKGHAHVALSDEDSDGQGHPDDESNVPTSAKRRRKLQLSDDEDEE
ncbi:hypothetical protein H4219_005689 [Mycoemilia scoparia]|uniref:RNA polymerase-associated protein LEO1 n=1 Tax=Mycoemilia scoparia TaxID=417184 RepID=A0A9W7ZSX8_9FUNG|nr:hypothetical protein H4219_005689 [Mycoemilia scoparia]